MARAVNGYSLDMPSVQTFGAFVLVATAFCAIPGPNVLYIVSRTIADGRRAGVASVAGILCAGIVHVGLAAGGISALLASSQTAYDAVRLVGAGYLIVLGIRTLRTRDREPDTEAQPGRESSAPSSRAVALEGFWVNLLSPKTALFFLALLPQFVDRAAGPAGPQILVLGCLLLTVGAFNDLLYAVAAGAAAKRLRRRHSALLRARRTSGVIYIALGVGAAVTGGHGSK